jgi:hypothetical protein
VFDDLNQYAATMHFNGQSTVVPCRAVLAAVIVTASPAASMTVTWGDAGWASPDDCDRWHFGSHQRCPGTRLVRIEQ